MSRCAAPLDPERLAAYWHGELPDDESAGIEQHLFSCGACTRALERMVQTMAAIAKAVRTGQSPYFASTRALLRTLEDDGVALNHYTLPPGGQVNCRATDDLFQVVHLRGDFGSVERLNIALDISDGIRMRLCDVPINRSEGEVSLVWPEAALRDAPDRRVDIRLYAAAPGEEREIASYTLLHSGTRS